MVRLLEPLAEQHWSYMDRFAATMIARGPTLTSDGTLTGSVHIWTCQMPPLPAPSPPAGAILDNHWCDSNSGLTIHHEGDSATTLRSPGLDQAALHGALARVRDLGAALIRSRPDEAHAGREQPDEPRG